jgi:hypothetical protein
MAPHTTFSRSCSLDQADLHMKPNDSIHVEVGKSSMEQSQMASIFWQPLSPVTPPCERCDGCAVSISHGYTAGIVPLSLAPTKLTCQHNESTSNSSSAGSNRAIEHQLAQFVQYQSSGDCNQSTCEDHFLVPFTPLQRLSPTKLFYQEFDTSLHDPVRNHSAENCPLFMPLQHLAPRMSVGQNENSVKAWMNSGHPSAVPENPYILRQHNSLTAGAAAHEGNPNSFYGAKRTAGMHLDADLIFCSRWKQQANSKSSDLRFV